MIIKRCPFCGGAAHAAMMSSVLWKIVCTSCVSSTDEYPSKPEAIAAWNRRPGGKP